MLPVRNAWDGTTLHTALLAGPAEVERAIAAAFAARGAMAALPVDARRDTLEGCAAGIAARREAFEHAIVFEAGKPVRDARIEVDRAIDTFRIAAAEALRVDGAAPAITTSPRSRGLQAVVRRVPVGACSFITPFNFPLNLAAHKVAPAIAAGCPFVLKPSERTPRAAYLLGEVLAAAGLPDGAFSVLPCTPDVAAPLVEDDRIALLSFTGGVTGWSLRARAGRKHVLLELGGNAACIVDADPGAPLAHVADRIVQGAYAQAGQSCISVQRIIVHRDAADALLPALAERIAALRSGDPMDACTELGPMIDAEAATRVAGWIADARRRGARVLVEGATHGAFMSPWLLAEVPPDSPLLACEAFAPVACVQVVDDFEAALACANDSRYGLQAGVFTASLANAMRAWQQLDVGGVVVGDVPTLRADAMPYGGTRGSGLGREGVRYMIEALTQPRLLVLRG